MIIEFTFTWPAGDYSHALECYVAAREFVLDKGLTMGKHARNIAGAVHSPAHPEWKTKRQDGCVPNHLMDDHRWFASTRAITDDEDTAQYLRTLELPPGVVRMERQANDGDFVRPSRN